MPYLLAIAVVAFLVNLIIQGVNSFYQDSLEYASTPIGLSVLIIGLVLVLFVSIRAYVSRKVRSWENDLSELDLELKKRAYELQQKDKRIDATIKQAVAKNIEREKRALSEAITSAGKRYQRLLDSSYKFKVKTLLSGLTLNNQSTKHDQLLKERSNYKQICEDMRYFGLIDNSDWDEVKDQFYDKLDKLQRAFDEKQEQAEIKRQMKEEKQRAEQLEKAQREAEEEEKRLEEQRRLIEEALAEAEGLYREELERQRSELNQQIEDTHKMYERAKSMAQMTKQGHVYVISNIGSFGENVFKVGMTRRLEPMQRVKELGDASVPFEFDVHAMISCDDAPALETKLHTELAKFQMNRVNPRKEFFKVHLDEIIRLVKENHGEIEYVVDPVALQYYQSLELEATAA